ncbi:PAN/Apple domain-containing protein [Hyphomonas sp.]|uniref:PAN/Apple domain-containing protein n=1 Tax=Hyphomonas sp. TaxID=87 RepID=UPI00391DA7B2
MRLVLLIAAACLGLAAMAHADGREGRTLSVPSLKPLDVTETQWPGDAPGHRTPGYEYGVYRFGSTFSVKDGSTPAACETACQDASSCRAWSFVESYGASPARCELKRGGGRPEENRLAVSGYSPTVRAAMWGSVAPVAYEPAPLPGQLIGGASGDKADAGSDTDYAALTEALQSLAAASAPSP